MHKLFMLHEPIKCLLVPHLMLIKMIIMLLVFFEIANQIDKSDEMPGNICAARQQQPAAKPAPVPRPRLRPPPPLTHRMTGRYAALPDRQLLSNDPEILFAFTPSGQHVFTDVHPAGETSVPHE
jgi:hypothetical protein